MTEHRIRFRLGWEGNVGPGLEKIARLTLPIIWSSEISGPIVLTRRFSRPPIDSTLESVRLELLNVPGLQSIFLNGNDLGPISTDSINWSVSLEGRMETRNILIVQAELPDRDIGLWGSIALVIGRRHDAQA